MSHYPPRSYIKCSEGNKTVLIFRLMNEHPLHVYLAWRPMQHKLAALAYRIENFLWGDARAQHTCLVLRTDDERFLMIEIDVGDVKHGIRKSMKLIVQPLEKLPEVFSHVELLGTVGSFKVFEEILRLAEDYVTKYPKYNTLRNNCRTFIDHIILQIPEFRDRLPMKNGSVLEYYHARAKIEHPGIWAKTKRRIQLLCYLHVMKSVMLSPCSFLLKDSVEQVNRVYTMKLESIRDEQPPSSPSV